MSNVEQSLSILLPTLNDCFPTELISLSASLLAQSRNRASILKPEEEIARPYACAEIACKRLQNVLKLPALAGRPPCAPRVYKKLYAFLDRTLPARSPKKRVNNHSIGEVSQSSTPSKNVPSKPAPSSFSETKRKIFAGEIQNSSKEVTSTKEMPAFVMPMIREICDRFKVKEVIPHIFTGASIVLGLSNLSASQHDEKARAEVSTMVVALFFLVFAKARVGSFDDVTFKRQSDKALRIAKVPTSTGQDGMEQWIARITQEGWAEGQEWWDNVPAGVSEGQLDEDWSEEEDYTISARRHKRVDDREDEDGIVRPGLGTMIQEGNCWLSEDKRHDFVIWKNKILAGVNLVDASRS